MGDDNDDVDEVSTPEVRKSLNADPGSDVIDWIGNINGTKGTDRLMSC